MYKKLEFITRVGIVVGACMGAGWGLCWIPAGAAQRPVDMSVGEATHDSVAQPVPQSEEVDVIRLRAGKPPYVKLTANTLYRILVAEIAAQRGMYGMAAAEMLSLAKDTSDPRLARRSLEFYLAETNLKGALKAAYVWAKLASYDADAQYTKLVLAAANGQTAGLVPLLRQRMDQAQDKSAALSQVLGVLGRLNNRKTALSILDSALSPSVRRLAVARLALADVAQAAGDSTRALKEAHAALVANPRSEEAAQRVLDYGMKVDPKQAMRETRQFIAKHPDARRIRLALVAQLADNGEHDAALAELQAMTRAFPEAVELIFMQAQLSYQAHRLKQAQGFLEKYLNVQTRRQRTLAPGASEVSGALADAHILLARIAQDQGQYEAAIAELDRIDDPAMRFQVRLRQAAVRAKQKNIEAALAMIDQAQPADEEENVLGILTKAQILRDANRIDQAVTLLADADKALPDTVEIKYELAMLYAMQNKIADLERLLRQVIALDPNNAHAYNALGYSFAERNIRLPEALALVTQALDLSPSDPYVQDSMGWVKYRLGDQLGALTYLQRAYARLPEPEIGAHLGEVLWQQGRRVEAKKIFEKGIQQDPSNKTLRETLKRLGITL